MSTRESGQKTGEKSRPETTVVIPNWNGLSWLDGCLGSLRAQTYSDFRTILVDNGSGDGSAEYVRQNYPEVAVLTFGRNTGFCHAVNAGIKKSRSEFVILLNNDTVCEPGFVEALVKEMKTHPGAFSCSARMMQMDHPDLIDDAGDFYCALGWAFADGHGLEARKRKNPGQVFSACGGAAIYRRKLFDQVGFFDDTQFAYLEDVDIGWRARRLGFENRYAPDAAVMHAGSASSGERHNPFKVRLSSRNSVYIIRKNMPFWQVLVNLPLLVPGFGIKLVFFSLKGLGRIYISGLASGLTMPLPDDRKSGKSIVCDLRIQADLWLSVFRRLILR